MSRSPASLARNRAKQLARNALARGRPPGGKTGRPAKPRPEIEPPRRGRPPGSGVIPVPPAEELVLLTVGEAVEWYGVSRATVLRWRKVRGIGRDVIGLKKD